MQHIKEIVLNPLSLNQFKMNEGSAGLRVFTEDGSIKVHYLFNDESPIGFQKIHISEHEHIRPRGNPERIGDFKANGIDFAVYDMGWSRDLDIKLHELIMKELRNIRRKLGL